MSLSLVPGEEEIGPQRRCIVCGDWWPLDAEFWYSRRLEAGSVGIARGRAYIRRSPVTHIYARCRACWADRSAAQYAARREA